MAFLAALRKWKTLSWTTGRNIFKLIVKDLICSCHKAKIKSFLLQYLIFLHNFTYLFILELVTYYTIIIAYMYIHYTYLIWTLLNDICRDNTELVHKLLQSLNNIVDEGRCQICREKKICLKICFCSWEMKDLIWWGIVHLQEVASVQAEIFLKSLILRIKKFIR